MTKATKRTWLPLSLVVGVAVALLAGLGAASLVQANPATVALSSATVEPGASASVKLSVTPASGEVVGAITVDVAYPTNLVTATACTPAATCNPNFATGKVRFTAANPAGISGDVATITFDAGSSTGTANLTVTVVECANDVGTPITCTASNGSITIAQPTPTPTPAPTATPTPTQAPTATPTPRGLPPTGGSAGDGSDSTTAIALGTLGLAVLAGGVWAVSRMRRETL